MPTRRAKRRMPMSKPIFSALLVASGRHRGGKPQSRVGANVFSVRSFHPTTILCTHFTCSPQRTIFEHTHTSCNHKFIFHLASLRGSARPTYIGGAAQNQTYDIYIASAVFLNPYTTFFALILSVEYVCWLRAAILRE